MGRGCLAWNRDVLVKTLWQGDTRAEKGMSALRRGYLQLRRGCHVTSNPFGLLATSYTGDVAIPVVCLVSILHISCAA